MDNRNEKLSNLFIFILPWIILAILLFYTYAKFMEHTYDGFRIDTNDGRVATLYTQQGEPSLQEGDKLIKIGPLRWTDFQKDLRQRLYQGFKTGQTVPLLIERDGHEMTIAWTLPGPNAGEIQDLLINEGWLTFVFWLVGTWTMLNLRPKDSRWRLMIAFNYLTAIWLAAGSGPSSEHVWESAIILRMAVWMCLPVYLHFHWVYPQPLGKIPAPVLWSGYILATSLAILEWFQLLPHNLYFLGFLIAIAGSVILVLAHMIRQRSARRDLRLLLFAVLLSIVPAIVIGSVAAANQAVPLLAGAGVIGLPFLPLTYFYAAYRRQLGHAELRINRLVSIYIYLILQGIIVLPILAWVDSQTHAPGSILVAGALTGLVLTLVTIFGYPRFQTFVERHLLNISYSSKNLLETYSDRITTSASLLQLVQLLEKEILPSLLVRQFAFLQTDQLPPKVLSSMGLDSEPLPSGQNIATLASLSGRYRFPETLTSDQLFPWAHLVLPLQVNETVIGYWLFGRRDPDDFYAQTEMPTFKALANQTAIALSNILQAERLRALYQADIDRYEQERLGLALDLHDSILNQLAVLMMNVDDASLTPQFQEAYDGLTQRLREIVSDLRPPMLSYGLKPALEGLADRLMEHSGDTVQVQAEIQTGKDECRYDPKLELHLFRIIQEASENALQHAQARHIRISGRLDPDQIELGLSDDGTGFEISNGLDLDTLLANKHFGLAGMIERAAIIGAEVQIDSGPGHGTTIRLSWKQSPQ